ncbi:MAG: adenylate kinase [Bdellovibrio sp.]|nr:adenylate kinase [Bdellovibrio sp.]
MISTFDQIDFTKLKKINVIGTTGAGKSTLSKKLAVLLGQPFIEIDQIFWGPNWKKPTNRDFYDNLKSFLDNNPTFVLDGNYTKATALKWAYTETVIWVNLPFAQTLWQLIGRTLKRLLLQKELWPNTGNRESIYGHLFTNDSIFYWLFKTFKGNQIKFKSDMVLKQWAHIQFIELTSNAQVQQFLQLVTKEIAARNKFINN